MVKLAVYRRSALALALGLALGNLALGAEKKDEWVSLFDGKTLKGWHQEGDGQWLVEDGAIVGKTQEAAKLYGLLVSDGTYGDFTLRFQFKSIKGNSGFYIRMELEKPDKAHGLQIEVDPRNSTGGIYESYGRAWVSQPKPEEVAKYFKLDQWNEMEITAQGGDVTVKVNGVQSAQLKNDPSRRSGRLAMQMHAGNEMLVMFKDIQIKTAEPK
ncbi:MAG: 3-keto-disaccharide hydrolase [Thermoguttaceae bacterium]